MDVDISERRLEGSDAICGDCGHLSRTGREKLRHDIRHIAEDDAEIDPGHSSLQLSEPASQ